MEYLVLLQKIRDRSLELRRTKHPLAATLTTLLSDIASVAKDSRPPRDPTDEDAVKVIGKYLVVLDNNIALAPQNTRFVEEKTLLSSFLPEQLSNDELKTIIHNFALENRLVDLSQGPNIGKIIKYLNANYSGRFNPKTVNGFIRSLMEA